MDLRDRVALISGGARIGQAVAKALADEGTRLVLTYRTSKESALRVAEYAKSLGVECLLIKTDLTLNPNLADIIAKIKRTFGRLDILINMASIYEKTPLKTLGARDWDRNINANLRYVYELSLRAAPLMKKAGGRVINFTDWTAGSGRPRYKDLVPYYVAKSGVIGLTEVLALELAPKILVNAIAPGPIIPPERGISKAEIREVEHVTPLKRWGGPEEIVKAVLFLIASDFVTGECVRVDGGRHLY